MDKVELVDFSGGFSEAVRADLLADNVCQVFTNCEVNINGKVEVRSDYEHIEKMFVFQGEHIVRAWQWDSYFRYIKYGESRTEDHIILCTEDSYGKYRLYLFIPIYDISTGNMNSEDLWILSNEARHSNHALTRHLWDKSVIEDIFKDVVFDKIPSISVTDRHIYVLGEVNGERYPLQYVTISREGRIIYGQYGITKPTAKIEVLGKNGTSNATNSTGLLYGSILQYAFTFEDKNGLESPMSDITTYTKDQFLWNKIGYSAELMGMASEVSDTNYYLKDVRLRLYLEIDNYEIDYINIYRRDCPYTEGEVWSDFSKVKSIKRGGYYHYLYIVDNSVSTPILYESSASEIVGEEIVYQENRLFISDGYIAPFSEKEVLYSIVLDNTSGPQFVNKVIAVNLDELLYRSFIFGGQIADNAIRFVDSTGKNIRVFKIGAAGISIPPLQAEIYGFFIDNIPANSIYTIYIVRSEDVLELVPLDKNEIEFQVCDMRCLCCVGNENLGSEIDKVSSGRSDKLRLGVAGQPVGNYPDDQPRNGSVSFGEATRAFEMQNRYTTTGYVYNKADIYDRLTDDHNRSFIREDGTYGRWCILSRKIGKEYIKMSCKSRTVCIQAQCFLKKNYLDDWSDAEHIFIRFYCDNNDETYKNSGNFIDLKFTDRKWECTFSHCFDIDYHSAKLFQIGQTRDSFYRDAEYFDNVEVTPENPHPDFEYGYGRNVVYISADVEIDQTNKATILYLRFYYYDGDRCRYEPISSWNLTKGIVLNMVEIKEIDAYFYGLIENSATSMTTFERQMVICLEDGHLYPEIEALRDNIVNRQEPSPWEAWRDKCEEFLASFSIVISSIQDQDEDREQKIVHFYNELLDLTTLRYNTYHENLSYEWTNAFLEFFAEGYGSTFRTDLDENYGDGGRFSNIYISTEDPNDLDEYRFNPLMIRNKYQRIGCWTQDYNNTKVRFESVQDHIRKGEGLLYYSGEDGNIKAGNYFNCRSDILKLVCAPLFMSDRQYNSLLVFYNDRIDRLVISKDSDGALLDRGVINNVYNQHIVCPSMCESVCGDLYFMSAEGIMRFNQSGVTCISKHIIPTERLACDEGSFIQYIPDKRQIWFYFHKALCLVFDIDKQIFSIFKFNKDLVKGYFKETNFWFTAHDICRYPAGDKLLQDINAVDLSPLCYVTSKRFSNKRKLKKIKTKSKFVLLYARVYPNYIENPSYYRTVGLPYRNDGVYVIEQPGFKGDLELLFIGVESLENVELWVR